MNTPLDRDHNGIDDREDLIRLARGAMRERGLLVLDELPVEAMAEAPLDDATLRDLTGLPWSSIDNPTSRDLDQVELAEQHDGFVRVMVGIADVVAYVPPGCSVDTFASTNTTTVYTAAGVFPMLPRTLSEGATSLLDGVVRRAMVTSLDVDERGVVLRRAHFPALVRNQCRLDYESVSAWLDGGECPAALADDPAMQAQVRLQEAVAARMRARRDAQGALAFISSEPELLRDPDGNICDVAVRAPTRAGRIVESLMLAVNEAVALTLAEAGMPCLRRVVPEPPRWNRLRELAEEWGGALPETPSSFALSRFLEAARAAEPDAREELDLAVVKLVGRGEYRAWWPGDPPAGHFPLATAAYAHSTAPNRRYADVVVQRILYAALRGAAPPYDREGLDAIAARCTERTAAARRVERKVWKSAAALLLADRVGEEFEAVVSGVNGNGVWVRPVRPAVEGRLLRGADGLDVGTHVRARLIDFNIGQGHLDFETVRVGRPTG